MSNTIACMGEKLFDNPTLSDVKIKQIYNENVREYYAHKVVLCMGSDYFMNMFTGNFKEATNKVIELHEDDPEHFKILLKFIYTNSYDKETISKLAADDKVQCILMPIGIYKVADKYNISRIYELVTKDIQDVLTNTIDDNFEILQAAIHAHYGSGATVDNLLGKLITSVVLNMHTTFTTMPAFEGMIQLYPMFGADVALAMTRRNQGCFIKMVSYTCKDCFETSHIDFGRLRSIGHKYFHCSTCGNDVPVGFLPSST